MYLLPWSLGRPLPSPGAVCVVVDVVNIVILVLLLLHQNVVVVEIRFLCWCIFIACKFKCFKPRMQGTLQIFIFKCLNNKIFFDKTNLRVVIFTWKLWNVLKRMKNQFSEFCNFLFLRYGRSKFNHLVIKKS